MQTTIIRTVVNWKYLPPSNEILNGTGRTQMHIEDHIATESITFSKWKSFKIFSLLFLLQRCNNKYTCWCCAHAHCFGCSNRFVALVCMWVHTYLNSSNHVFNCYPLLVGYKTASRLLFASVSVLLCKYCNNCGFSTKIMTIIINTNDTNCKLQH